LISILYTDINARKKINKREKSCLTRVREFLGGVQESGNKEFFSGKNLSLSEDGQSVLNERLSRAATCQVVLVI
jgi:hypothetical protein